MKVLSRVDSEKIQILKERIEVQQVNFEDAMREFIIELTRPTFYMGQISLIIHRNNLRRMGESLEIQGLRLDRLKENYESWLAEK